MIDPMQALQKIMHDCGTAPHQVLLMIARNFDLYNHFVSILLKNSF